MRLRTAAALVVAIALSACGTWDPTSEPEPEATRSEPIEDARPADGQAELTVGDGTYNFELVDCFVTENDGVRFSGRAEDGARITGQYDPAKPDEAAITVTDKEGVTLYTSNGADPASPEFKVTEGGFNASGAFSTQGDDTVDGSVSGAC